jgi:hypothetical protein
MGFVADDTLRSNSLKSYASECNQVKQMKNNVIITDKEQSSNVNISCHVPIPILLTHFQFEI